MKTSASKTMISAGLWRQNPALVQLLGLCPLLAVSNTVINGFALALASGFVLLGASCSVSVLRRWIHPAVRLPFFVLIIATFTTAVVTILHAWAFELYLTLALFLQIIVTNCAILGRIESFASQKTLMNTFSDALGRAIGFGWVLVLLGALREWLAYGTLLRGAEQLWLTLPSPHWLLASGPAGAFFALGLIAAAANALRQRQHGNNSDKTDNHAQGNKIDVVQLR